MDSNGDQDSKERLHARNISMIKLSWTSSTNLHDMSPAADAPLDDHKYVQEVDREARESRGIETPEQRVRSMIS